MVFCLPFLCFFFHSPNKHEERFRAGWLIRGEFPRHRSHEHKGRQMDSHTHSHTHTYTERKKAMFQYDTKLGSDEKHKFSGDLFQYKLLFLENKRKRLISNTGSTCMWFPNKVLRKSKRALFIRHNICWPNLCFPVNWHTLKEVVADLFKSK